MLTACLQNHGSRIGGGGHGHGDDNVSRFGTAGFYRYRNRHRQCQFHPAHQYAAEMPVLWRDACLVDPRCRTCDKRWRGRDAGKVGVAACGPGLARISHTRCGLRRFKKPTGQEPRAARCGASGKRGDAPCRLLQPALRSRFGGHLRRRAAQPYVLIRFRRPTPYLPRRKRNAGRMECEKCGLGIRPMLRSLIAFCLARRPLVLVTLTAFIGLGWAAFTTLNIEAYPDPAPPILELIAQWPGQSPEEVERYVTIPIEIAVANTPGLKYIRSNTVYALGFIRLQFEYGRDYHFVRQQTINRLKDATLPNGVQPVISPAGGISEILRYQLKGPPGMDLIELKTLQDWVVERKLRTVPGVADVTVLGGKTKEFQAEIDLNRMMAYGITLPQIMNAITAGNSNVGGRTLAMGEQSVNVRGLGNVRSLEDIGNIVLTQQNGVPVLLSDVAKVQVGFTPRLGVAGRDDKTDIIFGVVLMQKFERTMDMVLRVRDAIERINTDGSLPPGVVIEPFYDRGDLVAITVRTVLHNMLFGIALIFLIQWIFLGDLRCAIIVSATIPVALFLAVIITVVRGESANLLSVGAIDLGIIVDSTVIMLENIFRHLAHAPARGAPDPAPGWSDRLHRVLTGAVEVDKAILFSVVITIAAFLPLFTMQGVEG